MGEVVGEVSGCAQEGAVEGEACAGALEVDSRNGGGTGGRTC